MEQKVFKSGESVSAEFMTDVARSVYNAEQNSVAAKADSQRAKSNAATALQQSTEALTESNLANSVSASALYSAQLALEKANEVERKANNNEFDGRDGVVVQEKGLLAFSVENGELYVSYSGDDAPNLSIDTVTGELIYNY